MIPDKCPSVVDGMPSSCFFDTLEVTYLFFMVNLQLYFEEKCFIFNEINKGEIAMFKVEYRKADGKRTWARNRAGQIIKFSKRQQARQWCRNHGFLHQEAQIIHPNGDVEDFDWKSHHEEIMEEARKRSLT